MALELEGKIVRRLAVQRGVSARGNWAKQEFILEFQDGNYPAQACLNVWGEDKVKDLERFSDGEPVRVSFRISSREFNGRWYTDLRAWRIEPARQNSGNAGFQGQGAPQGGFSSGTGGGFQGPDTGWNQAPAPTVDDFSASLSDDDDDLPF